mmetsp:Transcript_168597/g.324061  ORF Transcript_168597/g.324061 Transcript_168597/m.324061 type:complete len:113 (-) Transcript_168597:128-466(-)
MASGHASRRVRHVLLLLATLCGQWVNVSAQLLNEGTKKKRRRKKKDGPRDPGEEYDNLGWMEWSLWLAMLLFVILGLVLGFWLNFTEDDDLEGEGETFGVSATKSSEEKKED